ncbi:hypothetical protein CONLIGDRAFT_634488 [Coniochaeta ligniaria NRRL 30616]|uniref:ER-bound oxygenase mpaB/mpaB'/Rubber oxygenase catalytic domain-containing protein n=1 Tax=Coniochaeta ligniaria NRRL 30616 TaxID=1408157 RepID=A0A1J7JEN0_9PEZI|nr:hypothetical protein CONLIGDRAFT_634488 [Coniochaeta ligniaria NRRL 30616]
MDTVSGSVGAGATTTAALPALPNISSPFPTLSFFTLSTLISWPSLATVFVLYVVLCRSLRFRNEKALLRRYKYTDRASVAGMSNDDASEIMRNLIVYEFPKLYHTSLQFAIFKTYGFETMSRLIVATKSFSDPGTAPKRYEDTVILFHQFQLNPPTSDLCIRSISRMNTLHDKYKKAGRISNADFLYTLSVCVTEPIKFINKFEWRKLNDLEVNAVGCHWKSIGDAMHIQYKGYLSKDSWKDGIEFVEDITAWAKSYEIEAMKPAKTNRPPADALMDLLLFHVPSVARPFVEEVATVLMGARVRDAFYYPEPSLLAAWTAYTAMIVRQFVLRHLWLPRFGEKKIFTGPDPDSGRLQHLNYLVQPYYQSGTFWNRWGPEAWLTRILGGNVPGSGGEKLIPQGFLFEDIGPAATMGKNKAEMADWEQRLKKERPSGCPFSTA